MTETITRIENSPNPVFSVIIPAYNEEELLPVTLEILANMMPDVPYRGEVIVTDNNSTDKTAEIAEAFGSRVVFEPVNQISRARNAGAKEAKGRCLIFLDADTVPTLDIFTEALDNLLSGSCCGGGCPVKLDRPHTFLVRRFIALWDICMFRMKVAAGCFVYCLKEAFDDIGGFNEKIYASEEIWFSRALKKWGRKHDQRFLLITCERIVSSSRKLDHPIALIFTTIIGLIFPFMIFFKSLCHFWYVRKKK